MFMNWKRQWPILLLLVAMGTGGVLGMANDVAGKTAPAKPVVNQLSPQEQALFDAVKAGDKEKVKKLIADGVDVNCHYADGFSPAHVAILRDNVDMLRLLEAHGLDSKTLLTVGIKGLKVDMCKKKQIATDFEYLSYPLVQVASAWGSARCTKFLLQAIPKDDWKVSLVCTPEWPIYKPFVCKNLLMGNKSEHSNCWRNFYGSINTGSLWNPFHLDLIRFTAWSHGFSSIYPAGKYAEILEWVKHQTPRTFDTSDKRHLSIRDIKVIAGTILVMIDERVMDTRTAEKLEHALDLLKALGVRIDLLMDTVGIDLPLLKALTRRGYNPAPTLPHWVALGGSISRCQLWDWLYFGRKIEAISWILAHGGKLPDDIMLGVWRYNNELVKFLTCIGADINARNAEGKTRLLMFCTWDSFNMDGDIKFLKTLLDEGSDPNFEDNYGWRALDYLFRNVRPEPIEALLWHGVDVSHTEKMFSYSVISYLIEEYTDLSIKMLHFENASPFSRNKGEKPLSHSNATSRHVFQWRNAPLLPFLQLLIQNGAEVNFFSKNGLTPLMEAAMIGRMDVVVLLVEKGGDIGMKARKPTDDRYPEIWTGKTAIELTAEGHPAIRDYLIQKAKEKERTQ